jgi:hypothetical protein
MPLFERGRSGYPQIRCVSAAGNMFVRRHCEIGAGKAIGEAMLPKEPLAERENR